MKGIHLPKGSNVRDLERSCRIMTLLSGTHPISGVTCPVTYIVLQLYVDLPVFPKAVNSSRAGDLPYFFFVSLMSIVSVSDI